MELILASQSPRRRRLLSTLGLDFTVAGSAPLDEARILAEAGGGLAERLEYLAILKGAAAARDHPNDMVISADTVVVIDGEALGKPPDAAAARRMLSRLSGRTHEVLTAVAVQCLSRSFGQSGVETTRVTFATLAALTIDRYIARAQPFDKAGAYAIQGLGALLVERLDGDYPNVVGLPLRLTARLLAGAGIEVL